MVPTYFRRELRDRALQRPSRLRTFVFCFVAFLLSLTAFVDGRSAPFSSYPAKAGIQYAAASRFYRECSGILVRPVKPGDDK